MDRQKPQQSPALQFLHDEASAVDSFGPHKRIAELISEAICTDPGIRIVGLLGPWGSGKSTVVGFVETALAGRSDVEYLTFTFDAWLNQGDSPRRAFLEALVRFVADNALTPGKDWTEQLHRITGRLDVTRTVETPLNSALASMVRLAVPVTALGVGLLAKASDLADLLAGGASAGTWFGVITSLVLPAAGLVYYVASRPTWRFWTGDFYHWGNWWRRATVYRDEPLASLLLLKTGGTRQNKVYRDPTPSSIEFQTVVHSVLGELAKGRKRLLVVIDNLDRLPEEEALGLWAVIRTFFLGDRRSTGANGATTDAHATILLPIDEKAVERLYSRNGKGDDSRARAESFMDKTFDLTLRLPRPAFLDWQDYVGSQLGVMFPTLPNLDAVRIVTRLLDAHFLKDDAPITPRRIKSILNRIGVAWLQWHREDLTFASIAWYAIDQQAIDTDIMAAVASRAPVAAFDDDWRRALAAMHFGVSAAKAMSVLLEGPLRRAIDERSLLEFRAAQQLPGFDAVLARVLEAMVQQQNAPQGPLTNAAFLVAECISDTDAGSAHLWTQLAKAAIDSTQWLPFSEEESEGLINIAQRVDPGRRRTWLQQLVLQFNGVFSVKASNVFAATLADLLRQLPDRQPREHTGTQPFNVPGNADFFVALLAEFAGHPLPVDFRTTVTAADLGSVITGDFANLAFSGEPADERIRALFKWGGKVDWEGPLGQAENAVMRGSPSKAGNALLLLGLLQATHEQAHDAVARFAEQNTLAGRISEASQMLDAETVSRGIALSLAHSPGSVPHLFNQGSPESDWPELWNALPRALDEFSLSATLTTSILAHMAAEHRALAYPLEPLIEDRVRTWHILTEPVDGLMLAASALRSLLEPTLFETAIVRLAGTEDFWAALGRMSVDENTKGLFELLIRHESLRERALETLTQTVSNFSESQWETVLWRDERVIPLLSFAAVAPADTSTLQLALTRALDSPHLAASEGASNRWLVLAGYLAEPGSGVMYAELCHRLVNRSPFVPLDDFLLGPAAARILLRPAFAETPDLVLLLLADELVVRVDNEHVLRHVVADMGILIRRASHETRRCLDLAISSLDESIDPVRKILGRELRLTWALPPPENGR
ncbi:KAP family NTPase [Luteibacter anthropi]|uniref:P-loop NTPase fold protein n=1 Tax=Luteibacter anthropi TaxID=564369 RepID=UPI002032789C|nr:P-loop NTPase fold protein [Luteibacter anthropi]URX62088.1 KAP family NTPase [Luteibacter anthropi]